MALIGSNIRFIGPVNPEPRVDTSKMSKRTDLSLAEKIALLDKIHSQPQGTSHRRLAELLAVPKSTIGRLVRQEQELRQRSSEEETQRVHPGKRKRCGKDPEVEEALKQWFSAVLAKGVRISGPILKSKAEDLARKLGKLDFIAMHRRLVVEMESKTSDKIQTRSWREE